MSSPSDFPLSSELSEDNKPFNDDVLSALNTLPSSPFAPVDSSSLTGKYSYQVGGGDLSQSNTSLSNIAQRK